MIPGGNQRISLKREGKYEERKNLLIFNNVPEKRNRCMKKRERDNRHHRVESKARLSYITIEILTKRHWGGKIWELWSSLFCCTLQSKVYISGFFLLKIFLLQENRNKRNLIGESKIEHLFCYILTFFCTLTCSDFLRKKVLNPKFGKHCYNQLEI